jgi:hypothetical protein
MGRGGVGLHWIGLSMQIWPSACSSWLYQWCLKLPLQIPFFAIFRIACTTYLRMYLASLPSALWEES